VNAANADAIFLELADLEADVRQQHLHARCGDDPQLRREVEALLAQVFGDLQADVPTAFLDPQQLRLADARAVDDALVAPGARLDEFTVLRVIGSGGSGVVYVAQQDRPRRTVALKVLRRSAETAGMRRRFALEAELLGRLQNPGIAQVFKARFDDPLAPPFIAMELVNGPPLTEYADARQLGLRDRLLLAASVCDAVHHAHQRGVIHRDLKPANILVGEDGRPKVLDFGVARAVEDEAHLLTVQTMAGQVLGTLPFMSPEQVSGEQREVDTRTDIYTLGVIVYRLLTGRMPFDLRGHTLVDAARRICDEEPPRLGLLDRALRGDVDVIVARAMAKDKERRYQSAAQLAADLRHAAAGEPIAALDDSAWYLLRRRLLRYRRAAIAAGAALVVVLGFAAYALRARLQADTANARLTRELSLGTIERGRLSGLMNNLPLAESMLWRELREGPNAEVARWALRELYLRSPSAWVAPVHGGELRFVRISPDGHLALTNGLDGIVRLWDTETGTARGVLPAKASLPIASFSSDTQVITGSDDGRLRLWDVATGTERQTWPAHDSRIVALATAADLGLAVSADAAGDLRTSRLADGVAQWTIASADAPGKDVRVNAIAIDPAVPAEPSAGAREGVSAAARRSSARWLAVAWSSGHVDLRALDTGRLIRRWRAHDEAVLCAAFQPMPAPQASPVPPSPDGHHVGRVLVTGGGDRTVRVWDLESGRLHDTLRPGNGTVRNVGFSPDGRLLAVTGWWRIEIWDVPRAARVRGDIGAAEGWWDAQFTHAGAQLVATSSSDTVRAWELRSRAVHADSLATGDTRVTSFVSDDTARTWILTTNTGGVGSSSVGTQATLVPAERRRAAVATASPDGQWLASTGDAPAVLVWRVGASPGTARAIDEPGRASAATFSPDARWLAVGFLDGRVLLWDMRAGQAVWRGRSEKGAEVLDLAFDTTASRLVSAHRDTIIELWRVSTGEHVRTMQSRTDAPFSLAIDRAGRQCAIGFWDGRIELWDLDRGQRERDLAGHSRLVTALEFDHTSGRLFSASRDGTVRVWDVGVAQELAQLAREPVGVEGLRVTADAATLIYGTEDGRIVRVALDQLDHYVERNASVWPK